MKALKVLLLPVLLLLFLGALQVQKQDIEKEKEAIMAVMEEETAAWYASDPERFAATYVNDEDFTFVSASKTGYNLMTGYKATMEISGISAKRQLVKEIKTPVKIKVYPETAWVVFRNNPINEKGEPIGDHIVTAFLEKVDGKWKVAYRNVVYQGTYSQPDNCVLAAINQAKTCGKTPEEAGRLAAEMFRPGWNQAGGYTLFANSIISNWRSMCMSDGFKVLEQDDNHAVLSACKSLTDLKRAGQIFNISYDDYLAFFKGAWDVFAEYMGATYKQEAIPEGVKIYISKK